MEARQDAWGAPRSAALPLRPLPWLSPVRLLLPHSRQPDGRAASCLQGRAGLQDRKMLPGREGFASSRVHLSWAQQGKLCDCKRLKLAPVFTFVGCHTA